ncbi:MAG: hypothetical protein LJE91_17020 [Gammaproteobacteria bacterium]|jgi:hypothetical protein|nr:hypothetical protein [Gammaproteobacteria bacterium]
MSIEQELLTQTDQQRRRRSLVLGLGIIALISLLGIGFEFRDREPNYYAPARTALVNARLRFEESLGHERALIAQLDKAHQELDSAINKLALAANLDPADQARIEDLRSSLLSIESGDRLGETNSTKLHRLYGDLLAKMDTLITDLENRPR